MNKLILLVFYCFSCFTKSLSENFCESNGKLEFAFRIENEIYFGVHNKLWTYDIHSKLISNSRSFNEVFGKRTLMDTLVTGFLITDKLLIWDRCEQHMSVEYCKNAVNARNLVIILFYENNNKNALNYCSFRWYGSVLHRIETTDEMPWNLEPEGNFETFVHQFVNNDKNLYLRDIYNSITKSNSVTAFTFGQNEESFLFSIVNESGRVNNFGRIISISILNNNFLGNPSFIDTKDFTGLFDIEASIYAVDSSSNIIAIELDHFIANQLNLNQKMRAQNFFNCNNEKEIEIESTTEVFIINRQLSSELSIYDPNTSEPKKSSSKWWIYLVIALIVMGLIGLGIYLYCLSKKAKNEISEKETESVTDAESPTIRSE